VTRPRVVATRQLPGSALAELAEQVDLTVWNGPGAPAPKDLQRLAAGAEGLLCLLTDRVDGALLSACPGLRVVSSVSVGLDHVDLAEATRRGIPVGNTPGVLTDATADLAFGLLLAAARRIPEADRFVRDGRWTAERTWEPDLLLGRELTGATLGLVGLGAIGQAMARRARGFGMELVGWTRSGRAPAGVRSLTLDEVLERADFLSIHVALAPETHGLIGAPQLAQMPRGAILINTSRGGIVDEGALAAALGSGQLAAAALDVFASEPLAGGSPLLDAPNLVVAPHIGSATRTTRERMVSLAVANLLAGLAGEPLPHCANPQVYEAP
jgi:glyoxylate reductase